MTIPDSVELAMKREQLETFTWFCCCKQKNQNLNPEKFGWKLTDDEIKPYCGLMVISFPF